VSPLLLSLTLPGLIVKGAISATYTNAIGQRDIFKLLLFAEVGTIVTTREGKNNNIPSCNGLGTKFVGIKIYSNIKTVDCVDKKGADQHMW